MAGRGKPMKHFFDKNADFNIFDDQYNDFHFGGLSPPNNGNALDAALAAILPQGGRNSSGESLSEHNVTPLLYQGAKFSSFEALSAAVDQYSRLHGVKLFRSDSRTLRSAPNRANPIIPQLAPVELVYYSLTYSCVFAGKSFKNFGQSKQPCRFLVRVNITRDYQQLEVTKLGDPGEHNHDRNGIPVCPSAGGPVTRRRSSTNKPSQSVGGSNHSSGGGGGPKGNENRDPSSMSVHLNHLMRTLHLFQQRNLFCDTSIVTKDGMLYAHSVVLAAVSPALYHALNSKPYVNRQPNMIDLSEYETKLVTLMIEFFYTGRLCMTNAAMLREVCSRLGVILEKDDGGLFEGESPPDIPNVDNIGDLGLDDFGLGLGIEGFDLLTADDFGGIAPDSFVLPSDFCTSPKNRSNSRESRMGYTGGIPNEMLLPDVMEQALPMSAEEKHDNENVDGNLSNSGVGKSDGVLNEQFEAASAGVNTEHGRGNESSLLMTTDVPISGVDSTPMHDLPKSLPDSSLANTNSHTVSTIAPSSRESEGTDLQVQDPLKVDAKESSKRRRHGKQPFDTFIRSLNKQLRYPCSNCCKVFRYEPSLNAHRWSHWTAAESAASGSETTAFSCDKCEESFTGRAALRSHSWSVHACPLVAPHVCTVCKRSFLFRSRLWRHMTSHTGVGALKGMQICSTCDRWYNARDFSSEHMAMHCWQRRCLCGACGKVFLSHTALAAHKRSHHLRRAVGALEQEGTKRFGCKQCFERFDTAVSAVIHKRVHGKEFITVSTDNVIDVKTVKTDESIVPSETNEKIDAEIRSDLAVVDIVTGKVTTTVVDSCEMEEGKVAESNELSTMNEKAIASDETLNSAACSGDAVCDNAVDMIEKNSEFETDGSVEKSAREPSTTVKPNDGELKSDYKVSISDVCEVEEQGNIISSEATLPEVAALNAEDNDAS